MSARNPGSAYGAALDRLNRAESKLRRTFHAWEKCRDALNRAERRLDQVQRAEFQGKDV